VNQIRQFLAVDAARIHQRTLYVADVHNIDVLQFAQTIQRAFEAPPVRQVPLSVLKAIAAGGDIMKKLGVANPPLTSFRLANLLAPMDYDLSETRAVAGPSPYNMDEGVRATVDWIRAHG
jgi:nucleoside-diphosphate-sugar epimerase